MSLGMENERRREGRERGERKKTGKPFLVP